MMAWSTGLLSHDCMAAGMCNRTDFHSEKSIPAMDLGNDVGMNEESIDWRHKNPEYWDNLDQLLLEEYGICTVSPTAPVNNPLPRDKAECMVSESHAFFSLNMAQEETALLPPALRSTPSARTTWPEANGPPKRGSRTIAKPEDRMTEACNAVEALDPIVPKVRKVKQHNFAISPEAKTYTTTIFEENSMCTPTASAEGPTFIGTSSEFGAAPMPSSISTLSLVKQFPSKAANTIKLIPIQAQAPKPVVRPPSYGAARSSNMKRNALNHNSLERQRRNELRSGYQMLLQSIPEEEFALPEPVQHGNGKCGSVPAVRLTRSPSKVQILNYAREYCLKLQQLSLMQEQDKERLVAKQQFLKQKLTRVTYATPSRLSWNK